MKNVTFKMFISLAAAAVAAPFLVLALLVGARAVALAHNAQDNLLLVALAFVGVGVSVLNGFGRRTDRTAAAAATTAAGARLARAEQHSAKPDYKAGAHRPSMMNPGY